MRYIIKLLILSYTLISLTGCATTKSFSPESKKNIHSISVDKIKNPDVVYYYPPGAALIGVIAIAMTKDVPVQLAKEAKDNNILISEMVRQKMLADLSHSSQFKLANDAKSADANLKIDITLYGFTVPNGFSSKVVPMLNLHAQLLQGANVVWENSYFVNALDGLPSNRPDDILHNPALMRTSLQDAVNKGVPGLLAKMK